MGIKWLKNRWITRNIVDKMAIVEEIDSVVDERS